MGTLPRYTIDVFPCIIFWPALQMSSVHHQDDSSTPHTEHVIGDRVPRLLSETQHKQSKPSRTGRRTSITFELPSKEAFGMSDDKKQKAKQVAAENGVVNPGGAAVLGAAPLYLALIPLTSYLTKPDSVLQKLSETHQTCTWCRHLIHFQWTSYPGSLRHLHLLDIRSFWGRLCCWSSYGPRGRFGQ
ncbi:hypothetical protein PMIN06_003469 [Paraphaeosphaeria minitans]